MMEVILSTVEDTIIRDIKKKGNRYEAMTIRRLFKMGRPCHQRFQAQAEKVQAFIQDQTPRNTWENMLINGGYLIAQRCVTDPCNQRP